jgi:hypothetical protein
MPEVKTMEYITWIVVFAFFLTMIIGIITLMLPIQPYDIQIKSLNDNNKIEGSFFLGSGSIKEEPVFVAYACLTNGGYVLKTFHAADTVIFEDNPPVPYIHVTGYADQRHYDIHVPTGTIIQQYTLDGKL